MTESQRESALLMGVLTDDQRISRGVLQFLKLQLQCQQVRQDVLDVLALRCRWSALSQSHTSLDHRMLQLAYDAGV